MAYRPPNALPNTRDARTTLQTMVRQLGYPYQAEPNIVAQLLDGWMHFRLPPSVMDSPAPAPRPPTAAPAPPQRMICLTGHLYIRVANQQYPIPLRVFIPLSFPHVYPLIYVPPYPGAVVPANHPFVAQSSGAVNLASPDLPPSIWRPHEISIPQLLRRLQEGFAVRPPLVRDPALQERSEKADALTRLTAARMRDETDAARASFTSAVSNIAALRAEDDRLLAARKKWIDEAGAGAGAQLAATREQLLRIEALEREYGGAGDLSLVDITNISSGNPLRDVMDDLEAEDKAVGDALEAAAAAMKAGGMPLDGFLLRTRELAARRCTLRTKQRKVAAEMVAAVHAEEQLPGAGRAAAGSGPGHGGGGAGGRGGAGAGGGGGASRLLMSGMLPMRYVVRGGTSALAPPPPPGPPPAPTGERLSFAS